MVRPLGSRLWVTSPAVMCSSRSASCGSICLLIGFSFAAIAWAASSSDGACPRAPTVRGFTQNDVPLPFAIVAGPPVSALDVEGPPFSKTESFSCCRSSGVTPEPRACASAWSTFAVCSSRLAARSFWTATCSSCAARSGLPWRRACSALLTGRFGRATFLRSALLGLLGLLFGPRCRVVVGIVGTARSVARARWRSARRVAADGDVAHRDCLQGIWSLRPDAALDCVPPPGGCRKSWST